ncbi:MAG: TIGR03619 family F420-dependent LLM class oxidoreductase [Myxococcota bacterium]|nr:TIGR03619 family F420-dependent LLM class oxidoreductase [Myxococcota bacterium]
MRFGISLPNNQGVVHVTDLVDLAVEAEAMGFASLWASEHLFHAGHVAKRLGSAPYHEALTVLTAAAARTRSARLGTSVLVLPWHHPVRLAKTIASLDDLSEGRFILGIGVGITEDEYANLGVPFERRGAITDEMLAALRELWTADLPDHRGEFFSFGGLRCEPKPRQVPLPIYIGGNSRAAFRRLRSFGQAWHPLSISVDQLRAVNEREGIAGAFPIRPRLVVQFLDEPSPERSLAGRKTMRGTADELRQMVDLYAGAGVDELILSPIPGEPPLFRREMERIAAELM